MCDRVLSYIVAFLSLTAMLVLLPTVVQAGPTPNCQPASTPVTPTRAYRGGRLHRRHSCFFSSGDVAKTGCHNINASNVNWGDVGEGACHGFQACLLNSGNIRKAGCIGALACLGTPHRVVGRGRLCWRLGLRWASTGHRQAGLSR